MIRPTVCRSCGASLATIQAGRFAPAEGVRVLVIVAGQVRVACPSCRKARWLRLPVAKEAA